MPTHKRQLILGAEFHQSGDHEGGWRMPAAQPWRGTDLAYYQALSREAERGKMDFVFFADFLAYTPRIRQSVRWELEPLTLLAGIAAATSHIGLVATGSTLYNEPYNLARSFATLDHISGGRAAWNIVTTGEPATAQDFGHASVVPHGERYAHAHEYVDIITSLWDSWQDDAVAADREHGRYAHPERIHPLSHDSARHRLHGALNLPRTPQGRPVLVQAGSSEDGRNFAARHAEMVFTAQPTLDYAQAFHQDLRRRAAAFGRDPDTLKILPGLLTVIGSTDEEAARLREQLDDLLVPSVYATLLAGYGIDLSKHDLDDPLPEKLGDISDFEGIKSRLAIIEHLVRHWNEKLTIRQLVRRLAGSRGHLAVVGNPERIADTISTWFGQGGADGFIIKSSHLPGGIQDFVDQVVPLLQARGIYRRDYSGRTLRDHLGLDRPRAPAASRAAA
ncbi:LLM class flavin-dependent oxidoreductase [Bordetella hinzii]|uniref:LLM class flavin-dependent oxidoreductase n=1 Tax=Bordetella hinzii TaxID=103855 RepID=UPI00045ACC71|nr:LLM class flavin-dependent oxidoreductase [Bordetella hinzii]KCB29011.1 FMN-dependent oxidoreductase, nitrilotriacetate monooxygenase family [Bordetella hinzii CA90 BAL1384]KCB51093.1 FMN-dependent oxidoreductase, nitrilotriacetate monooxygenase family [Bordetella hinzii 1277]MCJ9708247.1 LLM class flavin-dependent oxidoreductase [Bordetella hinzii]WPL80685.1 LLM class flavin-dependent oxidoreductase [Bordetella hinzii]